MNLLELSKIIDAKVIGQIENIEFKEIKMDSREIEEGDIFLIYGKGINYIDEAINNGCVALISEVKINTEKAVFQVSSILDTLLSLSIFYRNNYHGKVIAITGSNGKTTVKEMFNYYLSSYTKVLTNIESENNFLGVSKTMLKLNNSYDYLILELGMNHEGEIKKLSNMIKPDIGIITNIGSAHIGNLGSKENILKAKLEITCGNPNMLLFVNGLDEYLKNIYANKVYLNYESINGIPAIDISLVGSVLEYLGYQKKDIISKLSNFKGVRSRLQKIKLKDIIVIDDAYNCSYESILVGLEYLRKFDGKKLYIFGDILELGTYSEDIHKKAYDEIIKEQNITLITIGKELEKIHHNPHFYYREKLEEYLKQIDISKYSIIYLKASHKMGLSDIVSFLKKL